MQLCWKAAAVAKNTALASLSILAARLRAHVAINAYDVFTTTAVLAGSHAGHESEDLKLISPEDRVVAVWAILTLPA